MATHDYIISNASGAAVRADLNNALAAIATNNSSATEPTTTYAYQWWADTGSTPTVMKLRNAANSGWVTLFQLDGEWSLIPFENGTAAAPSIYFKDSGTDTGLFSPGVDQVGISAGGTSRFEVSTSATTSTLPVVHPLGAVGTPSVTFTGDLNTGIWSPAADTIAASTNGSERLRVTSTGNVGIGIATPGGKLVVSDGTTTFQFDPVGGTGNVLRSLTTAGARDVLLLDASQLVYSNSGSERFRCDSSGRLLVSTSTSVATDAKLQVKDGGITIYHANSSVGAGYYINFATDGGAAARVKASIAHSETNGNGGTLVFSTTADGASNPTERMRITSAGDIITKTSTIAGNNGVTFGVGFITIASAAWQSGAGTNAVKWNSSSGALTWDASSRLIKQDIEDCSYGIDAIKQLQPRIYTRKDSGEVEIGFIADEVQAVIPELVPTGPKSAITGNADDTEEIPISVNYDKFVAVLTNALQEAIAKIETLEAKVAALEAN